MLLTILAFIVALSILIVVHEYGHYRVAVACGVKVLRFSLGFGKPLLTWRYGPDRTEFAIAPIPFGGYVRMLDEREAPVDEAEVHRAFNRQPLRSRALIVAAGPVMNLILAVLFFAAIAFVGFDEPRAILAAPAENSVMQQAGIQSGDEVTGMIVGQGELRPIVLASDLRLKLIEAALSEKDVQLQLRSQSAGTRLVSLPLSQVGSKNVGPEFFAQIGYSGVLAPPVITQVLADGAAQRAGMQVGDLVMSVDGRPVTDRNALLRLIRQSNAEKPSAWEIDRNGTIMQLNVQPDRVEEQGSWVGKIGAGIGSAAEMVTIRYGILDSLNYGLNQTWTHSWLTLKLIGKMLVGQANIKNLSGPITIADVAGDSLRSGWIPYLGYLALISLSLGVLNLLPLPILDGGHLMYYLYEAVRGKPVSEAWMLNLQRAGIFLLLLMMFVATFNDITRLWLR
ncbi:RIP metalloprotease RseP [Saezia sanguinis]|uniref:RIP metalloprotease RseP n=1 Tax=Saezia sanguinis TaxID=1965230 RepID=UPI003054372E